MLGINGNALLSPVKGKCGELLLVLRPEMAEPIPQEKAEPGILQRIGRHIFVTKKISAGLPLGFIALGFIDSNIQELFAGSFQGAWCG